VYGCSSCRRIFIALEEREAFIKSIALFKRNALAAPFELAFKHQKELDASGGAQGDLMQIHYRDEEAIYMQASPDRVTVIFSTVFREETDRIFGKVFLQVCVVQYTGDITYNIVPGIRGCPTATYYSKRSSSSIFQS
jgi:hypothetical protein